MNRFSYDFNKTNTNCAMNHLETNTNTCQEKCEIRSLAENIHDPICRYDRHCRHIYVNHAVEKLCGQPASELLGKTPTESLRVILEDRLKVMTSIQHVISTGKIDTVEITFENTDGSYYYFQHLHVPEFAHDKTVESVLAIGRDISSYRSLQHELLWRENMFRTLVENSPDAIVRYDKNLKRIYLNEAWEKINHLSRHKVLGKSPSEAAGCLADSIDEFEATLRHILSTGESKEFVLKGNNQEGKVFFYSFRSVAEYDTSGNIISVLTISRDISSFKELEKELSSKEQLFRALAENSPDSIIRYDTSCRKIYVNRMATKTLQRSVPELLGETPTETKLLLNDKEFELKLQKVIRTKKESMLETSMISSGEQLWADIRMIPEFNDHGDVISVLSVGRNITERKKLEIHLSNTLYQFEQFINSITEMAWTKNAHGQFMMVNQVFADNVGATTKDIIGKTDFDFFPKEHAQSYTNADKKVFLNNQSLRFEENIVLPSTGEEYWIETIKSPLKDNAGNIIGTIGTARNITERKILEKKMLFMAQHDSLTELPNRKLAEDRAEQAITKAKRDENKVAFLFIDLDKFKDINDSLGHIVGDTMLKLIASRLQACIRETDTLSRQGGDEFLIILSNIYNTNDVHFTIEKIFKILEEPFSLENHTLFTSVSIGVSLYPNDGVTFNKLYQRADMAMYQAKAQGRNTYAFYSSHISSAMIEQLKLKNDLRRAIKNCEFILHYQPQINLSNQQIIGVEALIRWIHPELGLISPLTFIPLAEANGLIVEIGEWVLIEACKQAALWHQKQIFVNMAVNISAVQFKRGNLIAVIQKALDLSGLDTKFLELELTESIFIHNTQETIKTIKNIKNLGIMLSIDDFGTGYSSLTYLKRFSVDKLKIDKSFIKNLLQNQEDAIIVKTIIQMAKNLNLKTIAEGVEDKEVLEAIYHYGCDEVQGYYFAKPMEAQYITPRIDKRMKWVR